MATQTPNLNLTKPEMADYADIGVLNGNFDILDSAVSTNSNNLNNKVDKTGSNTVTNFSLSTQSNNIGLHSDTCSLYVTGSADLNPSKIVIDKTNELMINGAHNYFNTDSDSFNIGIENYSLAINKRSGELLSQCGSSTYNTVLQRLNWDFTSGGNIYEMSALKLSGNILIHTITLTADTSTQREIPITFLYPYRDGKYSVAVSPSFQEASDVYRYRWTPPIYNKTITGCKIYTDYNSADLIIIGYYA